LSETITPLEAGLGWTLALDKDTDFPGRDALRRQQQAGVSRRRVGLRLLEKGIPRAHQVILEGDRAVGEVTSGTHSPILNRGIAMAYVDVAIAATGRRLHVSSRGRRLEAQVVEIPFVPARVRRRRAKQPVSERGR
jgi:aminomethyltransferase